MKKPREATEGRRALDLIEEAFFTLRSAPAPILASYFAGTLPFLLGLLYFCGDMSRSAFAQDRLAMASFALTGLFFWMKTWHAIFARQLRGFISGEPRLRISSRKLFSAAIVQGFIHATGLFLLPVALVLLFPFGWLYAFYQNSTALAFKEPMSVKDLVRQAWKQARIWPVQNHYVLLLFKVFGVFAFMNVFSGFLAVPFLLKTIFGIQTRFSQMMSDPESFLGIFFNTTFFAVIVGVTYLCLDPLLKVIYVLRCFYGESLATGEDLKVELRRFETQVTHSAPVHRGGKALAQAAAILVIWFIFAPAVVAKDGDAVERVPAASVQASELDRSIDEVMKGREYVWRLPREKTAKPKEQGIFAAFIQGVIEWLVDGIKQIMRWIGKALDWLSNNRRLNVGSGFEGGASVVRFLLYVLTALLVVILGWLLIQLWRRHRLQAQEILAQPVQAIPNVADEQISADQLPEDGWLKLARELFERGELRLALRAYYLATLAHLAQRNLLTLAKFKSNRDYETELGRRGHALPELYQLFRENVSVFERIWYGLHDVNMDLVNHFAGNVQKINAT